TATISGVPAVTVANAALPVTLSGTIHTAADDVPARQAIQRSIKLENMSPTVCSPVATVPAGKRMVIEYVSLYAVVDHLGDQVVPSTSLLTPLNGFIEEFQLDVRRSASPQAFRVAQNVHLYSDPGSVLFCVGTVGTTGQPTDSVGTISGYLVDIP